MRGEVLTIRKRKAKVNTEELVDELGRHPAIARPTDGIGVSEYGCERKFHVLERSRSSGGVAGESAVE
jgi:hypothetical protein